MKTRFKNKWIWINTIDCESAFKVKILGAYMEADHPCYIVQHENGDKENILLSTVTRLYPVEQKNAPLISIKTKLALVK